MPDRDEGEWLHGAPARPSVAGVVAALLIAAGLIALVLTLGFPPPAHAADSLAKVRADYGPRILALEAKIKALEAAAAAVPAPIAAPTSTTTSASAGVTVSSADQLVQALAGARGGDIIALAPGRYDGLRFSGLRFSPAVTIAAADPARRPVLSNFSVSDSTGLTFSGLELQALPGLWSWRISGSGAIALQGLTVRGPPDALANAAMGVLIQGSDQVTVAGSDFAGVDTAVSASGTTGLRILGNHFHDLSSDAVNVSQSKGATVAGNYIHDLILFGDAHPDAIQMWAGASAALADVRISGNLIVRGAGTVAQGIFLADDGAGLAGVAIADNLVVGMSYNGLMVAGTPARPAAGVALTGNQVLSFADFASRIRLDNVAAPLASGNAAVGTSLTGAALPAGAVALAPVVDPAAAAAAIAAWRAAHPEVPR